MNPLTTISSSGLFETTQRIDGSRGINPPASSDDGRGQQAERAQQPASGVSVSISEAASTRAAEDLDATQGIQGSNASSTLSTEARRADPADQAPGRLVDVRA